MSTKEIAGKTVQVNDEGFMSDPSEWDKDIAVAIASEEGIAELTEEHWTVIGYCREVGVE
ncbi:MAG: TusE/DsrC/DsvC family sulfur relay protein, partial [Anaerolineales bacterium]